ncbi:hydroxymethylglutaryl-CoA synthase [Streptococcus didelphis]|uniref:Hydroxymethylglutaryl-CoA synthase n=1 Tax=Streptococcus didelphis TaxID=102886 RepID=A0ABY9LHI3_9STRE|nr:hydroxymethylglutaryl-CoA synthase [Streptococcus didelphis]WMB28319.1 hydroxymethylglutaryl-CoA synthase [Streptococcus didelphis]WMB29000.1 hydroxymethylglutaryl-CoA synthase [Streptococcus didelphis]
MKIGIDKIGFATSQYVLKMKDLAEARHVDPEKYSKGLMLDAISITPITEDIVTLAATASQEILDDNDKATIDMVILATESSIDQSKAASIYVHHLLDIQPFARSIEMKEACYSATAALDYAKLHVGMHPQSKVLVIASDIARYGIASSGEPTQGAGSIAMLVKADPRILILNHDNLAQTRDIMDFWRPNYSSTPCVNGIFSTKQYLDSLMTTWQEYQLKNKVSLKDFSAFCLHIPFPKLALKGLTKIMDSSLTHEQKDKLQEAFDTSIIYSKQVGNIYTGSLYLSLLSLLENSRALKAGDKIGMFSYGSGAVSEIFSLELVPGYHNMLKENRFDSLANRKVLSVAEYEELFYEEPNLDSFGNASFKDYLSGAYCLTAINQHQRIYQKNDKS